jgi:hypothetical protein
VVALLRSRTVAYKPNAIKNFLVAAHQSYFAKEDTELLIFHAKFVAVGLELNALRLNL